MGFLSKLKKAFTPRPKIWIKSEGIFDFMENINKMSIEELLKPFETKHNIETFVDILVLVHTESVPKETLEEALLWAVVHNCQEAIAYILFLGIDPTEVFRQCIRLRQT